MPGVQFALLVYIIFTGFSLINAVDSEHESTEWEVESDADSDEEFECKFSKSWVGQILCIFLLTISFIFIQFDIPSFHSAETSLFQYLSHVYFYIFYSRT